ncbi:hypothetical protein [Neolewinella agarilytica]|uniref:DUF378 domain-containing protein n=1 Tax=Neolewinella agarilytica TaxID=478744 RepID=A0A1H9JTD4_9BACT|nr:hypothetical protein [Neolewinella agarilytica]SEQ90014.1 hypothetical protein SAMN05444359_11860 [Neolewinella agarilytica]
MIKHSTTITVIGFLLLMIGIVTLFLNMVGVDLIFLDWLYRMNVGLSFAVRLGMVLIGIVMIYVAQTDWDREEA